MDLGPHAVFIWLCYAAVAVVLVGMILAFYLEGRSLARRLAQLERDHRREQTGGET
jgi:heme exporter protein CcmD